jgi:hypothetical protein
MRELFILAVHLLATLAKLMRPGGVRSVVAESLLLKHQLLTLKRSSKRAPKLTPWDRLLLGFGSACVSRARVPKIAIALKPSTLLRFHRALARLKYHLLYASRRRRQDNDLLIEVPTLKHGRAIATILAGRQPLDLTLEKVLYRLPDDWAEQRQLFGFPALPSR